jgi:hypothetical protein
MLKTVAFLKGHKWTTLMIKRVYFGKYQSLFSFASSADVLYRELAERLFSSRRCWKSERCLSSHNSNIGMIFVCLLSRHLPVPSQYITFSKSVFETSPESDGLQVWVLSFLSFGYATAEFEVTEERLGVYRPEEHIDNPKDYADNLDARKFDPRLRGPVLPTELEVDPNTGMKNYIANERGGWATSSGYIKYCFSRSIHFGRVYTNGAHGRGKEEDLCEALRCLGAGLHCMEVCPSLISLDAMLL